jgi:TRAP-type C4-dicarboxylate transport system permease large subunit
MTSLGLTQVLTNAVHSIGLSPLTTLLVIVLFYIILGFFMETLSMMIVTIPIITPVIFALGYDPVWFGILLMILLETALITPPIGLNLFVVQSIRQTPGPVSDVIVGSIPFVVAMFVMIGLLIIFPQIALWLPSIVGA